MVVTVYWVSIHSTHSIFFAQKPISTRLTYNCAHLRSTKESLTFEYDIYDGNGSVEGGTGWYLVVLHQYRAAGVDI